MALVKCKNCGYQGRVGFMPTTSCALLLLPGILIAVPMEIRTFAFFKNGHPFLTIAAAIVCAAVGFLIGVVAVHYIPWSVEWFISKRRDCPECGVRDWTYPFTEGFGL